MKKWRFLKMNWEMIVNGGATIEDLMELHKIGYEFPCGDGRVLEITTPEEVRCRG